MKLQADIGGDQHTVEIKRDDRLLFAKVDDREYELDLSEPEPGVFLFKHDGRVYEASVIKGETEAPMQVRIGSKEYEVRINDPKRLRSASATGDHSDGVAEIKTAMPGKVVRVLLAAGAQVNKGDAILVVEAMKMQNELKAPKAGVVKEIRAAEGSTVGAGEVLATIE